MLSLSRHRWIDFQAVSTKMSTDTRHKTQRIDPFLTYKISKSKYINNEGRDSG